MRLRSTIMTTAVTPWKNGQQLVLTISREASEQLVSLLVTGDNPHKLLL